MKTTMPRPSYLPPVEGYEEQTDDEAALADELSGGLPSANLDAISPAAGGEAEQHGGMRALGPADKEDLDAAVGKQLASKPPPPGSQMQGGVPQANPNQADDDNVKSAGDRDRMNRLLRGLELGGKQLIAGVLHQPVAEVVGENTNYEGQARAEASRNKDRRYAQGIDERNYSDTQKQREIALAHQKWQQEHQAGLDETKQRKDESDADFRERQLKSQESRSAAHNRAMVDAAATGKTLPSSVVTDLADFTTAQKSITALGKSFGDLDIGSNTARVSNLLPDSVGRALGTDVSKYNGDALLAMQNVGKIMEGGKLAQGDEQKYKSMLPKAGDNQQVAERKIQEASAFLQDLYGNRVSALKSAGYNSGGLSQSSPSGNDAKAIKAIKAIKAMAWAKAHPKDPRAVEILEFHGGP